jgi:hypothetical protein
MSTIAFIRRITRAAGVVGGLSAVLLATTLIGPPG